MIIKLILVLIFGAAFLIAMFRKFDLPIMKLALMAGSALALFFSLFPSSLTFVAQIVGVGRGADLVLYGTAVLLLIVIVAVSNQIRALNIIVTDLNRAIAIRDAVKPGAERPGVSEPVTDKNVSEVKTVEGA